ncbi:MAG: mandelate racemase/muconate lactonizing enzyme family protein [Planctomycetaceae bacterium]|jgi:L-alanine-DL-glutamate epimerase-like enolase superfamily enzyme
MKIQSLETFCVQIPLKPERRMISALGRHDSSTFLLVRLTTDEGFFGVGEATVTPRWSGETAFTAAAIIDRLFAPSLLGMDCSDPQQIDTLMEQLTVGNWFARAAVEMACWDAAGKAAGRPVYELLGGAVRPLQIRNRFSLGAYEPAVAESRAAQLYSVGFRTIKVKTGGDPRTDLERVTAVRRAIGNDCELTIDANGGWTFQQAESFLQSATDLNISLVEQPLVRGDYTGTRKLKDRFGIRILADESCFDEIQLRELLIHRCCDAVTLYPGKQGGLLRAKRLAILAAAENIPCTIGSNLEWDPGAAAMLHFVVSSENVRIEQIPGDCLGPSYHEFSIVRQPLQIEGPFTMLTDRPGLGIDVDWDLVRQHQVH